MADQYPGQTEGKMVNAPILDFRNRIGDLARPNLFQVEIGFPGIVDDGTPASGATPGSQEKRQQEAARRKGSAVSRSVLLRTADFSGVKAGWPERRRAKPAST